MWLALFEAGSSRVLHFSGLLYWLPFPRCVGLAGAVISLLLKRFANIEGYSFVCSETVSLLWGHHYLPVVQNKKHKEGVVSTLQGPPLQRVVNAHV